MKPKNNLRIGLDVGNYSVKCVQIVRTKDKAVLQKAVYMPLAGQNADNLTAVLKPLQEMILASPNRVRLVLSGSSLLVRCVALPAMTHTELKGAIRFEAENHIAFPIDDCILDFQILNQNPEKKTMNVLLVAAKRDFIQERLQMLADIDIKPEIIDVDTFCLVNAFQFLSSVPEEKIYGLLNIGHRISSFAIVQDGLPLFVRELPMGGSAVTKAIAESKGIAENEAEAFKVARAAENTEELKVATQKGLQPLVDEIKNSVDYYENESGQNFKSLWLSGGGVLSFEAIALVSAGLGKEAALWDGLKKLEIGPDVDRKMLEAHAAEFNVAFGLALRG